MKDINIYRFDFYAVCPVNGEQIKYRIELRSEVMILVENLLPAMAEVRTAFHEDIADEVKRIFKCESNIVATHGGVEIETHRTRA